MIDSSMLMLDFRSQLITLSFRKVCMKLGYGEGHSKVRVLANYSRRPDELGVPLTSKF